MKGLSVIIPTINRDNILNGTIEYAIEALKEIPCEIIVVNDSEKAISTANGNKIKILRNSKKGAASARNTGAQIAQYDYLIFLDDDILINKATVDEILNRTIKDKYKIFLPNWAYPHESLSILNSYKFGRFLIKINYYKLEGWIGQPLVTEITSNATMASYFFLIRKEDFHELGGYNDRIPYAGFEDYDISKRLKKKGFEFYILRELNVIHNESDRHELKAWLNRKKRNAATQKQAKLNGNSEIALHYSLTAHLKWNVLRILKPLLFTSAAIVPNFKVFDGVYTIIIKALTGVYIYEGYKQK